VSIRFNPSSEDIPEYLQGDKKLRAVKPTVEEGITVFMR
jgi:hypothetical protein